MGGPPTCVSSHSDSVGSHSTGSNPSLRYSGSSRIRNRPSLLGPYISICLGPYYVPSGGGGFLSVRYPCIPQVASRLVCSYGRPHEGAQDLLASKHDLLDT